MNKELTEVLRIYSTESPRFLPRLNDSSKETLIAVLTDLLTMYINDRNSSTLREYLTVTLSGYEHSGKKIGFNGFRQSSIVGGKPLYCEAKPKNFNTEDLNAYRSGKRKSNPSLLNGNGNFTDYTYPRLAKDREENPCILASGFVDGKLIYILKFPFRTHSFLSKIRKQLEKQFSNGQHVKGRFLRSANFDHRDYIHSSELEVVFLVSIIELEQYRPYINKKFFEFLHGKARK